jgi:hypothetical protein
VIGYACSINLHGASPHHPHLTSPRSILILSTHIRLGIPIALIPYGFPNNTLHALLFSSPPFIRATITAHHILLDLTVLSIIREEYKLWSSICIPFHSPVPSTVLGPNILLVVLFSNTLSLRSSLNVRNHVSHPYRTTGKIRELYILMFTFLDGGREDKRFWTEW